jgi:hypothetical protein
MNFIAKKSKITIGALLLLLGLVTCSISVYIFLHPLKNLDADVIKAKASLDCKKESESYGYLTTNKNGVIEISNYNLDNWENDLAGFSLIATNCNGFQIRKFCMGRSCSTEAGQKFMGTVMKLEYDGVRKNVVSSNE